MNKYISDFESIDAALTTFGLDQATRTRVYKVLAAILQLGNIEFEVVNDNMSKISNNSQIAWQSAANLLSIDPPLLQTNLLNRTIRIGDSYIRLII